MAQVALDVDALLAPIETGAQGEGGDLRADFSALSVYQRLRDARAEARANERENEKNPDAAVALAAKQAWRQVMTIGAEALAAHSKDFEIAAWLTEALVREHGYEGLSVAARVIEGLCEIYWEQAFPRLTDEDGLDARATPIGGLSGVGGAGTIIQPLRLTPVFSLTDGSPLTFHDWDYARETAGLSDERQAARYATGAPRFERLQSEASLAHAAVLASGAEIRAALTAWRAMGVAIDRRFGSEAPSLGKVTSLLEATLDMIKDLGGEPAPEEAPEASPPAAAGPSEHGAPAAGPARAQDGYTREDAFCDLKRIADFFRRTEPHSPLGYILEEAIRRGRMPFNELLLEVLPNEEARQVMLSRLGLRIDGN